MKAITILVGIWSLVLLFLGFVIVGVFPFYAGSFYWFTLPFLLVAAIGIYLPLARVFNGDLSGNRYPEIIVSILLPVAWFFALSQWPGGDDGPGIAWAAGLGLGNLLGLVFWGLKFVICRRGGS